MNLQDNKVGDQLAHRNRYTLEWSIETVTSVTKTQVGVGKDRYMRDSGRMVGSSVSFSRRRYIQPVTPELLATIERENKANALERRLNDARHALRSLRVTVENISRIEALIKESQP